MSGRKTSTHKENNTEKSESKLEIGVPSKGKRPAIIKHDWKESDLLKRRERDGER